MSKSEKQLTYNDFVNIFKRIKEEDTVKLDKLKEDPEKINMLIRFSTYFDEIKNDNENYAEILTDGYLTCGNTLSQKFKEVFQTNSAKILKKFVGQIPRDVLFGETQFGMLHLEPCVRIINTFNEYVYEQIVEFINKLYGIEYPPDKTQ